MVTYSLRSSQARMRSNNAEQAAQESMGNNIAFVFAHYSTSGLLDRSSRNLLESLRKAGRLIVVSTNLRPEEASSLHSEIRVITRDNQGYDFYSYKIGLEAIANPASYDYIVVLNSSFVCLEPEKLVATLKTSLDSDVVGLTMSKEGTQHLQSYCIAFSRHVLLSAPVLNWWAELEPISERQTVIERYELGLSRCLLANGFKIKAVFSPSAKARCQALCQAVPLGLYEPRVLPFARALLDLRHSDELNPTHFMWEELLGHLGIIKRDLIEKNPYQINLTKLRERHGERIEYLMQEGILL